MRHQGSVLCFYVIILLLFSWSANAKDLYKILGVDKNASQREVQKAFHRLSLKYHPDKNPSKSAQSKFAEINNAYEVLSDEEKRKNYDLYGDEQGQPRGPEPHAYRSYKTSGGGQRNFNFGADGSNGYTFDQHSYGFGGDGGSHGHGDFFEFPTGSNFGRQKRSFSFNFGGNANPFQDLFGSFFGSMGGNRGEKQHFTSSRYGQETENTRKDNFQEGAGFSSTLEELSQKNFEKKVLNQLGTWAILFVPTVSNDVKDRFQILDQVAKSLKGSIKVGYVDCGKQRHLCQEQNSWPLKTAKLRLYSLRNTGKLTGLDFTGEWTVTAVKKYCVEVLPKFSKHLDHVGLLDEVFDEEEIPMVVLLTKKKDTPAIWRALSGLFYGRIAFFDVQVDANDGDISARQYKVDEFPAIVGRYASGKAKVLSSGSKLEQDSSVEQIKVLLEDFEQKSKTAGPKKENMFDYGDVPSLAKNNLKKVCGLDISLCIIGVHKSSRGKDKLKQILKEISQKSLIRRGGSANLSKKPISYSLLDATKQAAFLSSFERSVSESENTVLIAYKPKRGTYTIYNGPLSLESAESFVVGVLGGDLSLKRVLQDPVLV